MWMMWMLLGVGERWRAERNARSNEVRFVSKEALERAGPQCVGWLKAIWLSMSTRAVGWTKDRGCIMLFFVVVCLIVFVSNIICLSVPSSFFFFACFVLAK